MSSDLLLRWSFGAMDTTSLSDFDEEKYQSMLWLGKLSIISFQKWFPNAKFVALYNGTDFEEFIKKMESVDLPYLSPVEYVNQRTEEFPNPYHFYPSGVWWKWIPFRLDLTKHEIAVDTDVICLSNPTSWHDWIDGDTEILVAPERYEKVQVNTTGDFNQHPLLKGKKPFNCGIVGQRQGHDFGDRFFEITRDVKLGHTYNSLFITEQGAINLWVRSLEVEGITHTCLDFAKNAWIRDFIYFLEKGQNVETVHAVAWHKEIVKELGDIFKRRIYQDSSNDQLLHDIVKKATSLHYLAKLLISKQFGTNSKIDREWLML